MSIYIIYNKRSCVTGRELFNELKTRFNDVNIFKTMKKKPSKNPDLIIRWGSTAFDFDCYEINKKESVRNASDKLRMMNILSKTEGVSIPDISFDSNNYNHLLDENKMAYFRNANDQIRYRSSWVAGDKYCVRAINKEHEYRVHVFNGNTIGIYEKIPESSSVRIFKNENCQFKRIDMSSEANRKLLKGVRPMAKNAVEALGLDFGGVDVILSSDGIAKNVSVKILEVNSSPALNSLNIGRFSDILEENVRSKLNK